MERTKHSSHQTTAAVVFRLALLCLAASIGVADLLGQTQPLRGMVLMPNGETPNRRLRLTLDDTEGRRINEHLYTDSNGRFVFLNVPDGNYRITVQADGEDFSTTMQSVYVGNRQILVHLKPPPEDALPSGKTVDARIPPKAASKYKEAVSELQKGKREQAEKKLREAIELYPDYFEALNDLGTIYLESQRLEEAEATLRRALEVDGEDFRPRYNLGVALLRQNRFADAAEVLRTAVEKRPEFDSARFYLGIALYGLRDLDAARTQLEKSLQLNPKGAAQAWAILGEICYVKKDFACAVEKYRAFLQAAPDSPMAGQVRQVIKSIESNNQQK